MSKPVVAIPDEPGLEVALMLARLAELGLEVESFDTWQRAGELREGQWLQATFLLEADLVLSNADEEAAIRRFGATYDLVERLLEDRVAGRSRVFMNPVGGPGAAGGVEGFNDLAWAAARLAGAGLRVAVVDLGAAWAESTESLLRQEEIMTISLHAAEEATSISSEAEAFININLGAGTGDMGLVRGVQAISMALETWGDLDVLVLGAGTDGLDADSSSSLAYTPGGFEVAGHLLGQLAVSKGASVLIGGGAANLPDSATPEVWASLFAGFVGAEAMTRAITST